jgi:dihydroorotate dehydrogenase
MFFGPFIHSMLYSIARPLLFQLDAERAHEVGLRVAKAIADRPWLSRVIHATAGYLAPVRVAGLTFPNRVGLAAGLDKNAVAPLAWWAFGFGFVELGTVTPRPQPGNPRPRMFREVRDRAIVNRMGFNNDGADAVAARLAGQAMAGRRPPIPIGISVGKNAATPLESAADDFAAAALRLAPVADFVSINVSSPNTTGLRSLQTAASLRDLVRAVRGVIGVRPLFVKVAPELTGDPLAEVVEACLNEGAAGMIATNTLATNGENGRPVGGLSGRPIREIALHRVEEVRRQLGDGPALIGCGGIDDVQSARAMLAAGADLIQIYTALVYEGPYLPARLARGL